MMRQMNVVDLTAVMPDDLEPGAELEPSHPNPTTGSARIGFTLPASTVARVVIEDVAGRRVATLLDTRLPAGRHEIIWDGRLKSGATAPTGVYFYRLIVGGRQSAVRRLVVLR